MESGFAVMALITAGWQQKLKRKKTKSRSCFCNTAPQELITYFDPGSQICCFVSQVNKKHAIKLCPHTFHFEILALDHMPSIPTFACDAKVGKRLDFVVDYKIKDKR